MTGTTCLLVALLLAASTPPTANELLARYDAVMGPPLFDARAKMTATREDGSSRTYGMRMLKGEGDRVRIWFTAPAAVKGQEILRSGDNFWLYLPNLKRATRIANRESFQGGDFNNADVLRVSYAADYEARVAPAPDPSTLLLELKAKHPHTAYEAIKLWFDAKELLPRRGQYFGTSGQLLRSAEFSDVRAFDGAYRRPARIVMQNELVKARRSELLIESMSVSDVDAPAQRFTQADLGR